MTLKHRPAGTEPAPVPSAPEPPPGEVKERIYSAALSLFAQKGYAAVSVREICRQARATPPMVYYYFGSKHGLYKSIRDESSQWRRREINKAARSKGTPLERLRWVLEAWAGVGEEPAVRELRLFFSRELFGLDSETYVKRVEDADRTFRRTIRSILQEGIDNGLFRPVRVEMAVLAISGILNTFTRRAALDAPITLEDGLEQVMDTFVYGLVARDRTCEHVTDLGPASTGNGSTIPH